MYQDGIKAVIKTKLKQKVREFATFFTGVAEGWFALSYRMPRKGEDWQGRFRIQWS